MITKKWKIKGLTLSSVMCDSHCISGCAKCAVLEQQLEMKSEEIKRLKEGRSRYCGLIFMFLLQNE